MTSLLILSMSLCASSISASIFSHRPFPAFVTVQAPQFSRQQLCNQDPHRSIIISCASPTSHSIKSCIFQLNAANYQPWDALADDDLVALPMDAYYHFSSSSSNISENDDKNEKLCNDDYLKSLRLCVIRNQNRIYPLVQHEDDVETDLFLDPRYSEGEGVPLENLMEWIMQQKSENNEDDDDSEDDGSGEMTCNNQVPYYGVGWYGQRPVPSLGGGPGYGATADEIWSIDEDILEKLVEEGEVEIPIIDVGMAHGEKARGGALF